MDSLRAKLADAECQLQKARQSENRAYDEADAAVHDAKNFREDVSFLTKETQRLNDELRVQSNEKRDIED